MPAFELVMFFAIALNATDSPTPMSDVRARMYFSDRVECERARPDFERGYGREIQTFLVDLWGRRPGAAPRYVRVEMMTQCRPVGDDR